MKRCECLLVAGLVLGLIIEGAFNAWSEHRVIEAYKAQNAALRRVVAEQAVGVRMCDEMLSAVWVR